MIIQKSYIDNKGRLAIPIKVKRKLKLKISEFVSVLTKANIAQNEIDEIITDIVLKIIPFSEDVAILAGKLTSYTKQYCLSFGDRACIATGVFYNMIIYTTDKIWAKLEIKNANIKLIR